MTTIKPQAQQNQIMAETVASRTTEYGTTLVLKRRPTSKFDGQYEYYVTEQGSNSAIDRLEPTKKDGMRQLRESVESYELATEKEESGGMSLGLGGSGGGGFFGMEESNGASLPDFGMGGEDDSQPYIPGFGMEESDDENDPFNFF